MDNLNNSVGVALIFFNRPEPLEKVFNALRQSKPKNLFLIQDGPRLNNEKDVVGIKRCREIVQKVDWDCNVYENFSETNLSCDHRVFTGISWAFEYVDRLVILEDDCVPSNSFLPFCENVLEKYKDDRRIHMISGMNYVDEFKGTDDSYFFSNTAAGWGWATWKRSWNLVVEQKDFVFLENELTKKLITNYIAELGLKVNGVKNFIEIVENLRQKNLQTGKVNSWENALGIAMFLSSAMIITPQKNLVSNIGLTNESTHAVNSIKKLSKATQQLFFKKTYEINFPLKHPKYIVRNVEYEKLHRKIVGSNNFVLFGRRMESIIRRFIYSSNSERAALLKKFF
ncbi:hypothetical protein [Flavobacterium lindanitolerans]|uniref:Uncharacterized protein n=1 Tax=Flavobacterium lindanitolerans TaxID=428988 RepID=A0A497TX27_9FLAO|nr:hypothetical protein [Flavobacterium lindanitolerans]PKW20291.1 hypothetical protein B0G92_3003 [Flavobacterium lindanitolerans]RLJ23751.1 hypothetical protein CLV50_3025 [Flavobacterium lindanitolerans]